MEWTKAQERIKALESAWGEEIAETDRRREVRYVEASIEEMRATGDLKEHEVYIARRVAEANIRREQAPYVNYITQARDLAKFRPNGPFELPAEQLEREFTKFGQYEDWTLPFFQAIDGMQAHGWDAVETVFDLSKPGHFCNRHVGHEFLLFPTDTTVSGFQQAPEMSVIYGVTLPELQDYVEKFAFQLKQVEILENKLKERQTRDESKLPIHKYYFRHEATGQVKVGWACSEDTNDWLRAPQKLFLGATGDEGNELANEYPLELIPYQIIENERIVDIKGRVFLDEHDQEACTQLATAFVNRAIVASWILAAAKQMGDDPDPKVLENVTLGNGRIISVPLEFFSVDPPDPSLLQGMMTLINQNANELGQVNFAAVNRKDSRKTAKEITSAEQQSAMLSSVQVTLLSRFLRNVWTRCWRILKSQVIQGKVSSYLDNWKAYYLYAPGWNLLAAGDIDVVRRQEILAAMKQDWPVMQNTAAAQDFLEDIIRFSPYGENAEKYIRAIRNGNRKDNLIMGMKNALVDLAKDPMAQQAMAAKGPAYQELMQEYVAVMEPQTPDAEQSAAPEPEEQAAA